ncbi:unnamed protein product, partial [Urochloa humidicola]
PRPDLPTSARRRQATAAARCPPPRPTTALSAPRSAARAHTRGPYHLILSLAISLLSSRACRLGATPRLGAPGARRGRAAACHTRWPCRGAARTRRGAAGPCLAAARATGGEAMALLHGRPELWWRPASSVTISMGGGGHRWVARRMYPLIGAARRCPPGLERFSPTHQETRPECRSLLTQAPPASSLCYTRHRRQAPPPAGPDLFQGCVVSPPSARHAMGSNLHPPI